MTAANRRVRDGGVCLEGAWADRLCPADLLARSEQSALTRANPIDGVVLRKTDRAYSSPFSRIQSSLKIVLR